MACRRNNRAGICFYFLFLVDLRPVDSYVLFLPFFFLSMSFLELFIYSYDGVSPPILSMPRCLCWSKDQIRSNLWNGVLCFSTCLLLFVSFFIVHSTVMGQGLGFMVMVSRHGGTYLQSQSDTFTGSTSLIRVRFLASKYEKILSIHHLAQQPTALVDSFTLKPYQRSVVMWLHWTSISTFWSRHPIHLDLTRLIHPQPVCLNLPRLFKVGYTVSRSNQNGKCHLTCLLPSCHVDIVSPYPVIFHTWIMTPVYLFACGCITNALWLDFIYFLLGGFLVTVVTTFR